MLDFKDQCQGKPTIYQWNARTISTSLTDPLEISLKKVRTTNLKALLNHFGGELVHAVFGSVSQDMVNGATTIRRETVLANVLNAPVAKLTMGNDINAVQDFVDARTLERTKLVSRVNMREIYSCVAAEVRERTIKTYFILLQTILEDILDDQATRFAQRNFVPHAT